MANFTSEVEMRSITGTITFIAPLLDYCFLLWYRRGLRDYWLAETSAAELVAWQRNLPITADTFAWCDSQIVFDV